MTAAANGVVLDGNQRLSAVQSMLADREPLVVEHDGTRPVIMVRTDIPDEDAPVARDIVVSANRIAEVDLSWDPTALKQLQEQGTDLNQLWSEPELRELFSSTDPDSVPPWIDAAPVDDPSQVTQLRDDPVFPSSNRYGIPDLRDDRLATAVPAGAVYVKRFDGESAAGRCVVWSSDAPGDWTDATPCFWRDDVRLARVWDQAPELGQRWLDLGVTQFVQPDFSTWMRDPRVVQMWNVYRSRWIARYWQELGLLCIPNIQWSDRDSLDYTLAGLPPAIPVAALQIRTLTREEEHQSQLTLIEILERLNIEVLLVYGEPARCERYAMAWKRVGQVVRLATYTERVRGEANKRPATGKLSKTSRRAAWRS